MKHTTWTTTMVALVVAAVVGCGDDAPATDDGDTAAIADGGVDVDASGDDTNDDAGDPDAADTSPGDTADDDATDTAPPDVALDVPPGQRNACGGSVPLLFDGAPATPGDLCGCDGIIVCDTPNAITCLGNTPTNACGGCARLPAVPETPCGACGGGTWTCDGTDAVSCTESDEQNACGGCAELDGDPQAVCDSDDGIGLYACGGTERVLCIGVGRNACGGPGLLDGAPGWPCGVCDRGEQVCDGRDDTACLRPTEGVNVCGGCAPLRGVPGEPCGDCGGVWQCHPDDPDLVVCSEPDRNACGGCEPFVEARLGDACTQPGGDAGVYHCDGYNALLCGPPERNACGGLAEIVGEPGTSCGACDDGRLVCAAEDVLSCVTSTPRNACGGCGALPGVPGEDCAWAHRWTCEGTELSCALWRATAVVGGDEEGSVSLDELEVTVPGGASDRLFVITLERDDAESIDGFELTSPVYRVLPAGRVLDVPAVVRLGTADTDGVDLWVEGDDGWERAVGSRVVGDAVTGELSVLSRVFAGRVRETVTPTLTAPENVSASDGTKSDAVDITWDAVEGAETYEVYRDDVLVARDLIETAYTDLEAVPGEPPTTPAVFTASVDRTDGVRVTWSRSEPGADGPEHGYAVVAVAGDDVSEPAIADTGYRAAPALTGYEISIDDGPWLTVPDGAIYDHVDAPPGIITPGAASASDGTSAAHVSLSLDGVSAASSPLVWYRGRAVAEDGQTSEVTIPASGTRAPGELRYQWQRSSADADADYVDIDGATEATWEDRDAPEDGSGRYYRCVLSSDGAPSATSVPDRGFRDIGEPMGAMCTIDEDCSSGHCSFERCSPPGYVYVAPGTFLMGDDPESPYADEYTTQREVTLTRAFYIAQVETAGDDWAAEFGVDPRFGGCRDPGCPAQSISWWDALEYANRLSAREGLDACYTLLGCTGTEGDGLACDSVIVEGPGGNPLDCEGYRLPTEAEFEYAYRAGSNDMFYNGIEVVPGADGCGETAATAIAWYCTFAERPPAQLEPNAWGLYDMAGNVAEWAWDVYAPVDDTPQVDPTGPFEGEARTYRGGNHSDVARNARAAVRIMLPPSDRRNFLGMRPVRTAPVP